MTKHNYKKRFACKTIDLLREENDFDSLRIIAQQAVNALVRNDETFQITLPTNMEVRKTNG